MNRRIGRLLTTVAVGASATGCGRGEPAGFERYVPAPGAARTAVVAALESWRRGDPVDAVAARRPEVHVVDKQRKPGRKMTAYELVGEFPAENARGMAVRVTFADDPEVKPVVRYLVVGTDPIWVFRQEDYEMLMHWSHPMAEASDTSDGPAPAR